MVMPVPLAELATRIDWGPFFKTWELAGRYPDILEDEPGEVPAGNVEYDELHTYERTATFDHAGRPRAMRLPEPESAT